MQGTQIKPQMLSYLLQEKKKTHYHNGVGTYYF